MTSGEKVGLSGLRGTFAARRNHTVVDGSEFYLVRPDGYARLPVLHRSCESHVGREVWRLCAEPNSKNCIELTSKFPGRRNVSCSLFLNTRPLGTEVMSGGKLSGAAITEQG